MKSSGVEYIYERERPASRGIRRAEVGKNFLVSSLHFSPSCCLSRIVACERAKRPCTMDSLPPAPFPILTSVAALRRWRAELMERRESVGFVPTMGALHQGHLSLGEHLLTPSCFCLRSVPCGRQLAAASEGDVLLPLGTTFANLLHPAVQASLSECDHTIVSIFVNPAQFAPHEDLATYPRTLEADIAALASASSPTHPFRKVSALFLPPVEALYPSGITTDVSKQRGTFLEVKGLQEVMEGKSRPGFFRGVATVVIKLFNLVQVSPVFVRG